MLNWIELIINSNSIHELIRALDYVHTEYEVAGVSIKEVTARTQFCQQK